MIRHFCDACEKEIKSRNAGSLAVGVHLMNNDLSRGGYTDLDGNPVSGRLENLDLCNACYNIIAGAAVQKLREIQAQRPSKES